MAESGIYEIVNLVNGKRYVGSAVNLSLRWRQHLRYLRRGEHPNRHLQRAWSRSGEESFSFRELEQCSPDQLIEREQAHIDAGCDYNICPIAGSTLGRKFTAAAKAKIGDRLRGTKRDPRVVEQIASQLRGRKRPSEHSAHLIGNNHAKGHRHTDEWKAATSARLKEQYAEGRRSRERPPEYRAKIASTLTGRKATPEHRANQSAAQRGKKRGPYKRRALTG